MKKLMLSLMFGIMLVGCSAEPIESYDEPVVPIEVPEPTPPSQPVNTEVCGYLIGVVTVNAYDALVDMIPEGGKGKQTFRISIEEYNRLYKLSKESYSGWGFNCCINIIK